MTRIGFYPGTFDPLHDGHLSFMQEAIAGAGLDKIYIMPEPRPRYKPEASSISNRIDYIRRSTADIPNVQLLTPDSERFTVDYTLPQMMQISANAERYLLFGSDALIGLYKWNNIETLLDSCDLIVGMRDGQTDLEVTKALENLSKNYKFHYQIIKTTHSHISSSDIRKKYRNSRASRTLLSS